MAFSLAFSVSRMLGFTAGRLMGLGMFARGLEVRISPDNNRVMPKCVFRFAHDERLGDVIRTAVGYTPVGFRPGVQWDAPGFYIRQAHHLVNSLQASRTLYHQSANVYSMHQKRIRSRVSSGSFMLNPSLLLRGRL